MNRTWTIALLALVATAACENMGLEYAGPAEEAQLRPPSDVVAAVHPPESSVAGQGLIVDGRLWVRSYVPLALSEEELRPIGSARGATVYARTWDQAPYDRVFTRLEESAPAEPGPFGAIEGQGWRSYLEVIGGGAPAGSAPRDHRDGTDSGGH